MLVFVVDVGLQCEVLLLVYWLILTDSYSLQVIFKLTIGVFCVAEKNFHTFDLHQMDGRYVKCALLTANVEIGSCVKCLSICYSLQHNI